MLCSDGWHSNIFVALEKHSLGSRPDATVYLLLISLWNI